MAPKSKTSGSKAKGGGGGTASNQNNGNNTKNEKDAAAVSGNGTTPIAASPASTTETTTVNATSNAPKRPAAATSANAGARKKKASSADPPIEDLLMQGVGLSVVGYVAYLILRAAYKIRLRSIEQFGPVIHEFDPYFNFRATEYLYWNGWRRFFTWFDYKVWYPLGRPVGTTIFPGMQFTAVWIKDFILPDWPLNDVCCYMPAWFGILATFTTGAIAYEACVAYNSYGSIFSFLWEMITVAQSATAGVSEEPAAAFPGPSRSQMSSAKRSRLFLWERPALDCGVFAMACMSIIPAHLMRSMGGGFDNESVAMSAMVMTFYFWMRSLRPSNPVWATALLGVITGFAYFYMVAAWGGYVFVLNLIGVHAAALVAMGRFSTRVYLSYSLFYIVGTALATRVPVVGMAPLRSLEQLGPCVVFLGYQLLQACEMIRRHRKLTYREAWVLRIQAVALGVVAVALAVVMIAPSGYFGPLSARVRGLFVKHTKTGNPLVDSVAEHQPASSRAYYQYLHHVCYLAPVGYAMTLFSLSEASSFLLVWGAAAYFFSNKMVRLILLTAPIASVLGGIALGRMFAWCIKQWWDADGDDAAAEDADDVADALQDNAFDTAEDAASGKNALKKRKKGKGGAAGGSGIGSVPPPPRPRGMNRTSGSSADSIVAMRDSFVALTKTQEGLMVKRALALGFVGALYFGGMGFISYSWRLSHDLSNPTIIFPARKRDGEVIVVDDYREAYWWLRDNTPEDARIMAWWDYGYQISAIANRTTIADGNTWNHEHIGLLGKALTTDLEEGWEIARHLADYVLLWGGGGGDDLAKSPHLARIANSVYRDHCPDDPTCRAFSFLDRARTPSAMMRRSLLFRLHSHKIKDDVEVPPDRFIEVYRSKYGKVRIFKIMGVDEESKQWVADPTNRKCDVPGSWFCPGQYPPGLSEVLGHRRDFQQIEDFNRGSADEEYQKKYFQDLHDPDSARRKILQEEYRTLSSQEQSKTSEEDRKKIMEKVDEIYKTWADTEDTTRMWRLINTNNVQELKTWLAEEPWAAYVRSKDGRGPMWWSFEHRNEEITKILMKAGVPHTDKDAQGLTPVDLLGGVKN